MKIRSLAAGAILAAVPAAILTSAAVSSASPAAPVAHARTITATHLAVASDSGTVNFCHYLYYQGWVFTGREKEIYTSNECPAGDYDPSTGTGWVQDYP